MELLELIHYRVVTENRSENQRNRDRTEVSFTAEVGETAVLAEPTSGDILELWMKPFGLKTSLTRDFAAYLVVWFFLPILSIGIKLTESLEIIINLIVVILLFYY